MITVKITSEVLKRVSDGVYMNIPNEEIALKSLEIMPEVPINKSQ